jgi:hypothetical protein
MAAATRRDFIECFMLFCPSVFEVANREGPEIRTFPDASQTRFCVIGRIRRRSGVAK